jgi:hypothetical protein
MGDTVGQLFYGAALPKIKRDPDKMKRGGWYDPSTEHYSELFQSEHDNLKEINAVTRYEQPYETENHYLIIVESENSAYNEGSFLGPKLEVKPEWDNLLKERAEKAGVKISEIGWHLVGHYN